MGHPTKLGRESISYRVSLEQSDRCRLQRYVTSYNLVTLRTCNNFCVSCVVIRQSLVQIRTPDEMRGRVSAVNSMFVGTSNQLGEFESGVTAAWFGLVPAVLIGGVGTIIVVIAWMRLFPQLARIDSL